MSTHTQRFTRINPLIATFAMALLLVAVATVAAGPHSLAAPPSTSSQSDVFTFAEPTSPVGTSTLTRTDDGIRASMRTGGVAAHDTLTLWWVVFNNPTECSAPGCGDDDIFVDGDPTKGLNEAQIVAADIVVAYADGALASGGGRAGFEARLQAGTRDVEVVFGDGAILDDASSAEVHLVARSHGPKVPGLIREQVGSFAGGCEVFLNPPSVPAAAGECADVLFSVHKP